MSVYERIVRFRDTNSVCPSSSSCGKHTYLAISTRSEVEKALVTPDTHDLAASFRRALAFSLPPITFYRNFRVGGRSDAVFGITLVDYATSRDREGRVPKIIGICIEDVEKRGLNINKIYAVSLSIWYMIDPRLIFESQTGSMDWSQLVAAKVRTKRKGIFIQPYGRHPFYCHASQGLSLRLVAPIKFYCDPLPSFTFESSQSRCLGSLYTIIDNIDRIKVSNIFTLLSRDVDFAI